MSNVRELIARLAKVEQERDEARAEADKLREIVELAVPALGCHARDFSQHALIAACEVTGADPEEWTHYPDVLARVRDALGGDLT